MTKRSIKRDGITDLFRQFAGQVNTITIPRPYIDLCGGDHLSALLLSQILYWSDRTEDADGWFSKSYTEWHDELAMTQYQITRAINGDKRSKNSTRLKDLGVESALKPSRHHSGAPTLHYRVDLEILKAAVMKFFDIPVINNVHNDVINNVHNPALSTMSITDYQQCSQSYTEITTETTREDNTNTFSPGGETGSAAVSDSHSIPDVEQVQSPPSEEVELKSTSQIVLDETPPPIEQEEPDYEKQKADALKLRRIDLENGVFAAIGIQKESAVSSLWGQVGKVVKWLMSMDVQRYEFEWFAESIRKSRNLPDTKPLYITNFLDGTNQSRFKQELDKQRKSIAELEEKQERDRSRRAAQLQPVTQAPRTVQDLTHEQVLEMIAKRRVEREAEKVAERRAHRVMEFEV